MLLFFFCFFFRCWIYC